MKVYELRDQLDIYIGNNHGNDEVAVRLSEPSIAITASERVKFIAPGIDWSKGKLFICTDKPLIHSNNQRDIPKIAIQRPSSDGKKRPIFHCPVCVSKIKKDMNYCPKCGQKVDTETYRKTMISYETDSLRNDNCIFKKEDSNE